MVELWEQYEMREQCEVQELWEQQELWGDREVRELRAVLPDIWPRLVIYLDE